MTFGSPLAFLLLIPVLYFLAPFSQRLRAALGKDNSTAVPFLFETSVSQIRELSQKLSWKVRYGERALAILKFSGCFLLVVALARPQQIEYISEADMTGRDIMLTLDLSGSMQAMDFKINSERVDRLAALKKVTKEFVESRKGDRLGMVVFGDKVFLQCPLTTDQSAVDRYVEALDVGMAGGGTAIGDALIVSLKRLRNIPEHSKVIILVTDGKNNAGDVQPKDAAELAKSAGVKIHVIGIGGSEAAPFPVKDLFGIRRLVNRPMEYDEESLKMIAETTGGTYFNAKDTSQLTEVYSDIDSLEKRVTTTYQSSRVTEFFFLPLVAGAILIALAAILDLTKLRMGEL
jgi:Ca-activated chloride channel family protein